MELIWSFGLVIVILLALNHMAGGRSGNVLGTVRRVCSRLVGLVLRLLGRVESES